MESKMTLPNFLPRPDDELGTLEQVESRTGPPRTLKAPSGACAGSCHDGRSRACPGMESLGLAVKAASSATLSSGALFRRRRTLSCRASSRCRRATVEGRLIRECW